MLRNLSDVIEYIKTNAEETAEDLQHLLENNCIGICKDCEYNKYCEREINHGE